MLSWLSANLVNIVLIAAIAVIVVLLIRSMIRDRKAGKSACGGNCACCGACSACSSCGGCARSDTGKSAAPSSDGAVLPNGRGRMKKGSLAWTA